MGMSKPYERLIRFCEAEMINPTRSYARIREEEDAFDISFPCLSTGKRLLKPRYAEVRDANSAILYGKAAESPYRDQQWIADLCEMLGLNSPWIPCEGGLPQQEVDVLVFTDGGYQDVALIQFFDGDGKPWWFNGDRYLSVTHYQPLPPGPLDRG